MIRNVEDVSISSSSVANIKQETRILTLKTEQLVNISEVVDLTDDIEEVVIPDLPRFKWMDKLETRVDELSSRGKREGRTIDPNRETIEILSDDEGPVNEQVVSLITSDNGSVDSGCLTSDPEDMLRAKASASTVAGSSTTVVQVSLSHTTFVLFFIII